LTKHWFALIVVLCDFSTLIYLPCIMLFRIYPVFFLCLALWTLPSRAAEVALPSKIAMPASAVSAASPEAEKTIYIEAQEIESKKDAGVDAKGNVEFQQGQQKVFANQLHYEQTSGDLSASGSVRMEQSSGLMTGPDLKMNMKSNIGEMNTPYFQFNQITSGPNKQTAAHGSAKVMRSTGKLNYEYENASYTTCPAGNDDWLLNMSHLELDRNTQIGTAYNAWIEFKGAPLLYTPWMNFPLDGRRLSGFLGPIYGRTTSGGTELTLPYYLNLAPNYDATISPRIMEYRGTLFHDEFRFMGRNFAGEINYDFMQNDLITNTTRTRSAFKHSHNLGGGFGLTTNFNRVSDDAYYRDFSGSVIGAVQSQLLNEGVLSYGGGWWSATLRGQTFQTLQDDLKSVGIPYERMPQLNVSAQKTAGSSQINIVNEYVDFRHPTSVNGQRLVVNPSLTYTLLSDPGYYLKPKFGIHHTNYVMGYNNTSNYRDETRTLPIFSFDSGMTFEREFAMGDGEYIQTLEPRLYYVKIPYQDQNALPLYDTSQAPFSFATIFTENRFFGHDRIGDANMATTALTSRLIDNEGGAERLRVTLGQRFSYQSPQVGSSTNSRSDILLALNGRVTNALTLDGLLQYDPNAERTLSYNGTARYKPEIGKVLNLGYRYTYVDGTIERDVRQGDFSTQWPLFWRWNLVSRWTYSFNEKRVLEQLAGLEYNQSCWMLRLVAQKFPLPNQKVSTGIFIQLELRDMVSLGSDPLKALSLSVPGYSKLGASTGDNTSQTTP